MSQKIQIEKVQKRRLAEVVKGYELSLNLGDKIPFDGAIFRSDYQETKSIKLSTLLNIIKKRVQITISPEKYSIFEITLRNGKKIKFLRNLADAEKMFSPMHFLPNFLYAFGSSFPTHLEAISFWLLEVQVEVDLDYNKADKSICVSEISDFKFLTCFLFGCIDLKLATSCVCYPTSEFDYILWSAHLGLNCVKQECRQHLIFHPLDFDPLMHSECNAINSNIIINFISDIYSKKNIFLNINNNQKISVCPQAYSDIFDSIESSFPVEKKLKKV